MRRVWRVEIVMAAIKMVVHATVGILAIVAIVRVSIPTS